MEIHLKNNFTEIKTLIAQTKQKALLAVNQQLIICNIKC